MKRKGVKYIAAATMVAILSTKGCNYQRPWNQEKRSLFETEETFAMARLLDIGLSKKVFPDMVVKNKRRYNDLDGSQSPGIFWGSNETYSGMEEETLPNVIRPEDIN